MTNSGVTTGAIKWGYIFEKVGLQIWGSWGVNKLWQKHAVFDPLNGGNLPPDI